MADNIYILMKLMGGVPEPVAITDSKSIYEDYVKTRKMDGVKTLVINRNHPKCPSFNNGDLYDHDCSIIDYYDECPITKQEEEAAIEAESEIHSHMLEKLSQLSTEINRGYIKFTTQELRDISELIAIIRMHISDCCDEDACVDLTEEMNFKELLTQSKFMTVPFKK